jgi:DnaJ domain
MDYKIALESLDIDLSKAEWRGDHLSLEYLKGRYHKMALKYHPDKNGNSIEATQKFQRINDAYEYLKREIHNAEKDSFGDESETCQEDSYESILKTFVFGIVKGEYNDIISTIIQQVVIGYKKISVKLFEGLNKENAIKVFGFLSKYKNILHISEETIAKVREIIMEKCKDDCVYILNPSIDDLLENNIYKLELDKTLYFVPLWHDELYFDGSGCEIIVKCIPNLPSNIDIDENNNLLIDLEIPLSVSLFDQDSYSFKIGKRVFHIPVSELKMQRIQYVCLKNQGISEIDENDMYNVSDKRDIHLKVTFVNSGDSTGQ